MDRNWQKTWIRIAYLCVALTALANSGCLLVAAGLAAGGATGYAYCQGKVCRTFAANLTDVRAATRTALGELGMPLESEEQETEGASFQSRTADGDRVRIYLDMQASRIPTEGSVTQVCVRVATFGDHPVSQRILDQIGSHLVPAPVTSRPPQWAPTPTPAETGPPPLAK